MPTVAELLDGQVTLTGESKNAFVPAIIDARPWLQAGRNELLVRMTAGSELAPDETPSGQAQLHWPKAGCARNPRGQRSEVRGQTKPLHMIAACDHLGCVRL